MHHFPGLLVRFLLYSFTLYFIYPSLSITPLTATIVNIHLQLMHILHLNEFPDVISWNTPSTSAGKPDTFIIFDKKRFEEEVMNEYFKGGKYSSFTRRLRRWNFQSCKANTSKDARRYWQPSGMFKKNDFALASKMVAKPQVRKVKKRIIESVETPASSPLWPIANMLDARPSSPLSKNSRKKDTTTGSRTPASTTDFLFPGNKIDELVLHNEFIMDRGNPHIEKPSYYSQKLQYAVSDRFYKNQQYGMIQQPSDNYYTNSYQYGMGQPSSDDYRSLYCSSGTSQDPRSYVFNANNHHHDQNHALSKLSWHVS